MGCGIFARGGYVKTSPHIVGCNAEFGELFGHGSVLMGRERGCGMVAGWGDDWRDGSKVKMCSLSE